MTCYRINSFCTAHLAQPIVDRLPEKISALTCANICNYTFCALWAIYYMIRDHGPNAEDFATASIFFFIGLVCISAQAKNMTSSTSGDNINKYNAGNTINIVINPLFAMCDFLEAYYEPFHVIVAFAWLIQLFVYLFLMTDKPKPKVNKKSVWYQNLSTESA